MKKKSVTALAGLFVVLAGATVGATGETKHAVSIHQAPVKAGKMMVNYAPADEYFGPSKMSLLGIRNQLHDLSLQYDVDHDAGQAILGKAKLAEACLRDWSKKYPSDPDISRHIYLLSHLYGKIVAVNGASPREANAQHWLLVKYPKSWYAKDEKKRMLAEAHERKMHTEAAMNAVKTEVVPSPDAVSPSPAASVEPVALPTVKP